MKLEPIGIAVALLGSGAQGQCEVAQLSHAAPTIGDALGSAVAIEGTTILAGAPRYDPAGSTTDNRGAVVVFERTDAGWIETDLLMAADAEPGARFGSQVALGDGRAIVSAPFHDDEGAVYVLERSGSSWVQRQKLSPTSVTSTARFGAVLALSGQRMLVGAPGDDEAGNNAGAAYVFESATDTWTLQQKLLGPRQSSAEYGNAVALDGTRALIGARGLDAPAMNAGAAYILEESQGQWTTTATLPGPGSLQGFFGFRVALKGDFALVSSGGTVPSGFRRAAGQWSALPPMPLLPNVADGGFDFASDPAGEGFRVLTEAGVVLFDGLAWSLDVALDSPADTFFVTAVDGTAVDGDTLVRGYASFDGNQPNIGRVLVDSELATAAYCLGKTNSQGCAPKIAQTGAPSANLNQPFTIWGTQFLNNKPGLLFYGVNGRAALPFQGGTLCVQPPLARTLPISSGGNPPPDDCSGVYGFAFNALIQSGDVPALAQGQEVRAQWYQRDPADPQRVGLSDALEFVICP